MSRPASTWATSCTRAGRIAEAIRQYEAALQINPDDAMAHYDLGLAHDEAGAPGRGDCRITPRRCACSRTWWKRTTISVSLSGGAAGSLKPSPNSEAALRLRPNYAEAHFNLGNTLVVDGRWDEAIAEYEEALHAQPDYPAARKNLELARAQKQAAQPAP